MVEFTLVLVVAIGFVSFVAMSCWKKFQHLNCEVQSFWKYRSEEAISLPVEKPFSSTCGKEGAIGIPMLLFSTILLLGLSELDRFMRNEIRKIQIQLFLDDCSSKYALEFIKTRKQPLRFQNCEPFFDFNSSWSTYGHAVFTFKKEDQTSRAEASGTTSRWLPVRPIHP